MMANNPFTCVKRLSFPLTDDQKVSLHGREKAYAGIKAGEKAFACSIFICACMLSLTPLVFPVTSFSRSLETEQRETEEQLLEAVRANDLGRVRSLIAQGAQINAETALGETPLHLAQTKEMAKLLLSKGADVRARDDMGMTPLFNAPTELVDLIIAGGADVNAKSNKGLAPLAWSAYGGDLNRIKLLVSKGADVNAGDGNSKTALHIAANWNNVAVARFLISKGARVNARDRSGWTPLHWASFEGGPEVAALLIAEGAERNAKTAQALSVFDAGLTPVDIAERAKHFKMIEFLKGMKCKRGRDVK